MNTWSGYLRAGCALSAVGFAAALLVGCGGGTHPAAAPSTTALTSITVQSSTPTPSTTSPTTPGTSSTAPVAPVAATTRCHTADLAITDDGGQGAGGTFLGTAVFRNVSNRTCTLDGYPSLQRLDANGQPMATSVQRTRPTPVLFSVQPQQQATFGYTTSDVPYGNATTCAHATTLEVTPPDETTHVNARSTLIECDPQGNVGVGALRPGKLNYSQYSTL
ncbi:MAG: DUF4232 domain-containing protein [Actinomycetota bacterium]|nr:DUF4232 domain-containing protein [Actinomycetota bacterium]MDQ6948881.1 DUF4232 domain-containing protein [Actinomycetota bacterium]